ncbi:MAG: SufB/SufD family protein [Methylocystaceae bacterium]
MHLDNISSDLMRAVAGINDITSGAFSLRQNGQGVYLHSTENIIITRKLDKPGIDIVVKPGTRGEKVHIPVLLTEAGLNDMVYNTFIIGEGAEVEIVAGCGIHNCGNEDSQHNGIHDFIVRKGASLRYVEKHFADGDGQGRKILNPTTIVTVEEGARAEMEMHQIRGVDDTERKTTAYIHKNGSFKVIERLLTHEKQRAVSDIEIFMLGDGCSAQVLSRSVAQNYSQQAFNASLNGKCACNGHVECDSIIMDYARISAVPRLSAESPDAVLTHEAAIGKIAGEQVIKLMTLGLSEKEAIDTIINGFLR